jgi:sugar lactone lactonase YvrE
LNRIGRFRLVLAAGLALPAAGCREAPAAFEAPVPVFRDDERFWQLTFNTRNDRSPAWSASGDSLFYMAESYGNLPATPGILLGIPRDGGVARPILANVQVSGATRHWLATPAVAPGGERVAFSDIWNVWQQPLCHLDSRCSNGSLASDPRLQTVFLRVRRFNAAGPLDADPTLRVEFDGRFLDTSIRPPEINTAPGTYFVRMYPFQRLWGDAFVFRPSWSPDGRRVAFSDGLRILIWDLDAGGAPTPVPGTQDGIAPAWSPDGQRLAFARLERGDSLKSRCVCYTIGPGGDTLNILVEERTVYTGSASTVVVVRTDGSERSELGPGDEPAWSPDGSTLFFRNEDRLWRVATSGGNPTPINYTDRGREPAVSPDGRLLAFSRRNNRGIYNIMNHYSFRCPLEHGRLQQPHRRGRRGAAGLLILLAGALTAGCGDPLVVLGDPPGIMRIVAGIPDSSGIRIDSLATRALLNSPRGVVASGDGLLYIADSRSRILAVTSAGRITPLVDHAQGCNPTPCLGRPEGLALDGRGGLIIADPQADRIWRLDLGTRNLTVLAGTGFRGDSPDGTPALQAALMAPLGVAVASDGTIYFTEFSGDRLRSIDATGVLRSVQVTEESAATLPSPSSGEGLFLNPSGLAIAGNDVYVSDSNNNRVLIINLVSREVRQIAGDGLPGFGGDGGPALTAALRQPMGLALSRDQRTLYIADMGNNRVRAVYLPGGTITTLAGTGSTVFAGNERSGAETSLLRPAGLAVSPLNMLYVADTGHHLVWRTAIRF